MILLHIVVGHPDSLMTGDGSVLAERLRGVPPPDHDESGIVDIGDILVVLSAWGPCP